MMTTRSVLHGFGGQLICLTGRKKNLFGHPLGEGEGDPCLTEKRGSGGVHKETENEPWILLHKRKMSPGEGQESCVSGRILDPLWGGKIETKGEFILIERKRMP